MDLYRKSAIVLLIVLSLAGCRARKITSNIKVNEKTEVKQVVTKENPFKIQASSKISFDSLGDVKPFKFELKKNNYIAHIEVKNNEITSSLENKDTIVKSVVTDRLVEKNTETITTDSKPPLSFWQKIKRYATTIAFISLIINLIFVAYKISKIFSPIRLPI